MALQILLTAVMCALRPCCTASILRDVYEKAQKAGDTAIVAAAQKQLTRTL